MLQNTDSSLHARQRHRRQQSTSSVFDGLSISQRPASAAQAHHRRARQSLDIRQQKQLIYQQQYAQQHSTQVSPGQHHGLCSPGEEPLISPLGTPQMPGGMDSFEFNSMYHGNFADWSMMSGRSSGDFDLYSQPSAASTPTYASFPEGPRESDWFNPNDATNANRAQRRSLGSAVQKRINEYENLSTQGSQRPITPPEQNHSFELPITPMETPHDPISKLGKRPSRFSEGYDESMEETLKPVRGRAAARPQSTFMEMRQQSEQQLHQITPSSSSASMTRSLTASSLDGSDFGGVDPFTQFVDTSPSFETPSQRSLPQTPQTQDFFSSVNNTPSSRSHFGDESPSVQQSAHRRNQSQASITSAQSIADIKIEETMQETGVTMEEIEQFISGGPGAADDGKYICTFEECGKTFGRKENIKSHVQTHLDDRKFLCQHCKKCFVRLHDLKRHAKIHTGIKPYVCQCGRDFARHDALTRHRQRGMCIGSFEGAVRASAKRGRPKKPRPDMDARQEKAAKTRKKNMSISSISSQVESAQSSAASTPRDPLFDLMNMDAVAPTQSVAAMSSSAPMPFQSAAPTRSQGSASPVSKVEACVSPQEIMEALSSLPTSPAKSMGSQHNTPPELSQSPSPAALTSFEAPYAPNSDARSLSQLNVSLDTLSPESFGSHSGIDDSNPLSVDEQFNELMLHFGDEDPSFVQMDHAPSMLLSHKSSEEYDDTVHMFGEPDDFFAM
ncbi:C2H2 transcription factor Swi5 [Sarocladium implicatum]|nr:C2H2 transcription factor Swi5 [Sarocladium implicatum]